MKLNKFVLIDDSGEFETYWTGLTDGLGQPKMSAQLGNALGFPSGAKALDAANTARSVHLERLKLGRRPQPIYLRSK